MTYKERYYAWVEALPHDWEFWPSDVTKAIGHPDESHVANGGNNAIGGIMSGLRARKLAQPIDPPVVQESPSATRKGSFERKWRRA